jgi:pimeloyl-ACP methyl ester carboxylesterase
LRRELLGPDGRWSVLGQSYGGFCALHYLGAAPEGLREVLITGGLAPLTAPVEDVYRATYARLEARNRAYLQRYPQDEAGWTRLAEHLAGRDERLPNGDRLTPRLLQFLGMSLGRGRGFEELHYLLEGAFVRVGDRRMLSDAFRAALGARMHFAANPLFAALHESIYAQGRATRWAAQRVLEEHPDLAYALGGTLRFTGEMIYPWMFEDLSDLRPLRDAAELLARRDDWPTLYDLDRLAANDVPVAAAVYLDDMFVDADLSLQTAARVGNLRTWVTNAYQHDGLRVDGAAILERLLGMARGEA